jgi:PAS domain S-box-containing protein
MNRMSSASTQQQNGKWLVEYGPRELELLLRAVLYHSSQPVLIADDDRNCLDASFGAGKLFALSRDQIIARRIDQLVEPSFQPQMERLWQAFLEQGGQDGTLPLVVSGGAAREVGYVASGRVLPLRHLLVLHDRTERKGSKGEPGREAYRVPSWVKDSAMLLLDADGRVAAWYAGAERIYGYKSEEAIGQDLSFLYSSADAQGAGPQGELTRAASGGRFGNEVWHQRKDRSRFWANVLTVALHDDQQQLQGFARVVRDFSDRQEVEQKLAHSSERSKRRPAQPAVVGIVSGEFDRVTDASDAFLAMVGYGHDDLVAGRPYWPDLTPPEYSLLDERAHEEGLIHGACAPFAKRKTFARTALGSAFSSAAPF